MMNERIGVCKDEVHVQEQLETLLSQPLPGFQGTGVTVHYSRLRSPYLLEQERNDDDDKRKKRSH